ncbi:ssDNA-binding protein [Bacillus phage Silence]|nr:ssDNA-binding protein [Bacillus phage Silence]
MLNRVVLVGRIVRDLELKYTESGIAVLNFGIAINRPFSNQNGEKEADFPNIVCFRKTAENTANFCGKGSLVGIDGRIQTRTYDGQNGRVYVTEVVAESVQFLEPKQGGSGGGSQQRTNNTGYTRVDDDPFNNDGGTIDISDDDLPF